ncbi:hypothetical protein [Jiella pacifica]|uniref:Uncharacterized protein n=1 Tax=Jiella pacifica TaxID=2696469 RepID=A0A6N9TB79_9HYPH|nr:hypothetical protein [Jiella pacifica]NDW07475.1 hypothetical protein [Jiella pacifica]
MTNRPDHQDDREPSNMHAADRQTLVPEAFNASSDHDHFTARILPIDAATLFGAAIRLGRLGVLSETENLRLMRHVAVHADEGDPTARLVLDYLRARADEISNSPDAAGREEL